MKETTLILMSLICCLSLLGCGHKEPENEFTEGAHGMSQEELDKANAQNLEERCIMSERSNLNIPECKDWKKKK